jgi:metal-dependent HD superfamily phosphatase/phosphodiesterase
MRTSAQRIARYNARMLSTQIDPTLAAVNAKACENFSTYVIDFVPNQTQMRALLSAAGILPVKYGAYEAFHGKLYHLSKVCSGPALLAATQILVDKWSDTQHLGATASTLLMQIADTVYHVAGLSTP